MILSRKKNKKLQEKPEPIYEDIEFKFNTAEHLKKYQIENQKLIDLKKFMELSEFIHVNMLKECIDVDDKVLNEKIREWEEIKGVTFDDGFFFIEKQFISEFSNALEVFINLYGNLEQNLKNQTIIN